MTQEGASWLRTTQKEKEVGGGGGGGGGGERAKKKPSFGFSSGPLAGLNKQREQQRVTLTVTALDLAQFRALSARLINTSFSFNGAGAFLLSLQKHPLFGSFTALPGGAPPGTADPVHSSASGAAASGRGEINRAIWEK